jgi:hypothetical protein
VTEIDDVIKEINNAKSKYGSEGFRSPHEGYAIIKEESDELWDEVKAKSHDYKKLYIEAPHIACTAIRFMELCKTKDKEIP